jgi:hypothetical protein
MRLNRRLKMASRTLSGVGLIVSPEKVARRLPRARPLMMRTGKTP